MSRVAKIYIGLLVGLFVLLFAIELSVPKPIDWSKSFDERRKKPYDTYIFKQELKKLLSEEALVEDVKLTPYEYFYDAYDWETEEYLIEGTFMYINEQYNIDPESEEELRDFARYGNTVFISSNNISNAFLDSLNVESDFRFNFNRKANLYLNNSALKNDSISFPKAIDNDYYKSYGNDANVLGYQVFDSIKRVNFIKVPYGDGVVYLHSQPIVFTNYNLLYKENKKYVEGLMSYLNTSQTIFYKTKFNTGQSALGKSELWYILSKPSLRAAYYLGLISLLFFIIFNSKRKQRIVPIIKPLTNTTIDFAQTIGNLYYETQDHKNIVDKKITYFLENIRRSYFIDTGVLDERFIKRLATKSAKPTETVQNVVNTIKYLRSKSECTENQVVQLNQVIEQFYKA